MTSVGQCFAYQQWAHTPGDPVRPFVIAGDIPVHWKLANMTSIFDPNRGRLRPAHLD
jgi:hypothetical protein